MAGQDSNYFVSIQKALAAIEQAIKDSTTTVDASIDAIAALLSPQTAEQIGTLLNPNTAGEIAAGVTIVSHVYPAGDIRRYGGVMGDNSLLEAGNNTALIRLFSVMKQDSSWGYFPVGVFRYSTDPNITLSSQAEGSFRIRGSSSTKYGTAAAHGSDARGTLLKYTGAANALTITGPQAPCHIEFEDISFLDGTGGAANGLVIDKGTFWNFRKVAFLGFRASGAVGLKIKPTSGVPAFTGAIVLDHVVCLDNDTDIKIQTDIVNIFRMVHCQSHSSKRGLVIGTSGALSACRNIIIDQCHWEETEQECIRTYGGIVNCTIADSYIEQNNNSANAPRIYIGQNGLSPLNNAVRIVGNTFSKNLNNAAERLIALETVRDATIKNNYSIYPSSGTISDRWWVEADSTSSDLEIDLSANVSGATSPPIRINGVSFTDNYNSKSHDFRGTSLLRNGVAVLTNRITRNPQNSNYTFVKADAGLGNLVANGGATTTYTIPPQSSVTWDADDILCVLNTHSTNNLTIARGSGVALYLSNTDQNVTVGPRRFLFIRRVSSDVWVVDNSTGLT